MSDPLAIRPVARQVADDFLRVRRGLYLYEFLYKSIEAWLLVPAIALALTLLIRASGRVAVSNWEIFDFLLTPLGLAYAAVAAIVAAGLLLLEQAGVMFVAALGQSEESPTIRRMLRLMLLQVLRVVSLGALMALRMALILLPLVALGVLLRKILLPHHDIYFYVTERPPNFWLAVGLGSLLVFAAAALALRFIAHWALALPILLFENQSPSRSLRASRERVRGRAWRIGCYIVGWHLFVLGLGAIALFAYRLIAGEVFARFEGSRLVLIGLLIAQGGILAMVSFFAVVGQGLLARRLYLIRSAQVGLPCSEGIILAEGSGRSIPPWSWRLAALSIPVFLTAPLVIWFGLPSYLDAGDGIRVTAHRGHARRAPENTLPAIRKAIEIGADYAEIDVALTGDGQVVLLHDRDFMRVARDPRRIDEVSLDEVRRLDVGSWFDPAFRGEKVPTLVEAIELARGRIRLNIELKIHSPDRGLARAVARILSEQHFEGECIVTSFSGEALTEMKEYDPAIFTGLIVAHILGDIQRLPIDAISVNAGALTDAMIRDSHRAGRAVHVWAVDDPRVMLQFMNRGVDNIITGDPEAAIEARKKWLGMSASERLLLSSRLLLGLDL